MKTGQPAGLAHGLWISEGLYESQICLWSLCNFELIKTTYSFKNNKTDALVPYMQFEDNWLLRTTCRWNVMNIINQVPIIVDAQ